MIPDAPWIREAERDGMPSPPLIICPLCGAECETVYVNGDMVVGCNHCVKTIDSAEWAEETELENRPDWADK